MNMKNVIYRTVNKALALTLMISIIAVGGYAVHLTHIYAKVTVSFGEAPVQTFAVADALDLRQLTPLPMPKAKVVK